MKPNTPYITKLHPNTPIEIREISEVDFESYKADCVLLNEFDYYQRRLREIELNIEEFFRIKEYYTNLLKENDSVPIDYDFKKDGFIDVNRSFINLITSFRSLTEHCEKKVIKIYGKDSNKFTEFKTILRNLHNDNLVYKLFDILRNFSVHSDYPIEFVNFDRITFDLSHQDCWYEVGIFFSKARFQKSRTIRKKLKTDMDLLDELTPVEPLITKLIPIVNNILREFIRIAKSDYTSAAQQIIELLNDTGFKNIGLTKSVINGSRIDYKTIVIPMDTAIGLIDFTT